MWLLLYGITLGEVMHNLEVAMDGFKGGASRAEMWSGSE